MGIKRFPGSVLRGTYSVLGALRVDASGYITGPLQGATGLIAIDASFGGGVMCASGASFTGKIKCSTSIVASGAGAQIHGYTTITACAQNL